MSTRTHRNGTARINDSISIENVVLAIGAVTLLAMYGSVTLGLVNIGLAPTFVAWLLAVGILGMTPLATVWLITHVLEYLE